MNGCIVELQNFFPTKTSIGLLIGFNNPPTCNVNAAACCYLPLPSLSGKGKGEVGIREQWVRGKHAWNVLNIINSTSTPVMLFIRV